MSRERASTTQATEESAPSTPTTRLSQPIRGLQPSARALTACEHLGIGTVADFLRADASAFLAVPGCGAATLAGLTERVHAFLLEEEEADGPVPASGATGRPSRNWNLEELDASLGDVVDDESTERSLAHLGITTLREFLEAPRSSLLAAAHGGEAYCAVVAYLRQLVREVGLDGSLMPQRFMAHPIRALDLDAEVNTALAECGYAVVGDLLAASDLLADVGARGHAAVRDALRDVVLQGLEEAQPAPAAKSFGELFARMVGVLDPDSAELLRQRIGLPGPAVAVRALAASRGETMRGVRKALAATRRVLRTRVPELLSHLREEAHRELDAAEGFVTGDRLAPGSLLHGAVKESGDPGVPLRLLCLCHPEVFFRFGGGLVRTPPGAVRALRIALRRHTIPHLLPIGLDELERRIAAVLPAVDRGLLQHLITRHPDLVVKIHKDHGEVVQRRPSRLADRACAALAKNGAPMYLEDLHFACAEEESCTRGQVLAAVRNSPDLLELGADLWDCRGNHTGDLEVCMPEAKRIAARIHQIGERQNVRELMKERESDCSAYLVASLLRQDPSLRDLGRGEFCPATRLMSSVLLGLSTDLRRAMGEVPITRFLDNKPPALRRLIEKLLHENRMFVEPLEDRVDLLDNYPFNDRSLSTLVRMVDDLLQAWHGYASLKRIGEHVRRSELGGDFLTDHLLGDVLRRHGPFEILPGGVVALASLELRAWIQHRAREALRSAGLSMTSREIVLEAPELAEFEECLGGLLEIDPMVACSDDAEFVVL